MSVEPTDAVLPEVGAPAAADAAASPCDAGSAPSAQAQVITVIETTPDDPRVAVYAQLKEAQLRVREGRFIAESPETIRLLLRSPYTVESLLLKPTQLEAIRPAIVASGRSVTVYVMDERKMSEVVGFHIHRGALGCGVIPPGRDLAWLCSHLAGKKSWRLLAIDGINDLANMGSMIRSASVLGMDAILISRDCCDPWYRRSIRVSMGHIFRLPVIRLDDMALDLRQLASGHQVESYAAIIDKDAVSLGAMRGHVPDRWCVVLGNEDRGVSGSVRAACRCGVRIDMAPDVDSLSVGVAAAVLMHGLRESERGCVARAEAEGHAAQAAGRVM